MALYAANFADVTAFQSIRRKDYSVPPSPTPSLTDFPPLSTYLSFLCGYFENLNFFPTVLRIRIYTIR
jgi:hypothetical protein